MSATSTRQSFIDEILNNIKPGQVGLAVIDHAPQRDVFIDNQGQAICFDVGGTNEQATDDGAQVTLDSLAIADLALILDSFADPDFGGVVPLVSLESNASALPLYFQDLLKSHTGLAQSVTQRFSH